MNLNICRPLCLWPGVLASTTAAASHVLDSALGRSSTPGIYQPTAEQVSSDVICKAWGKDPNPYRYKGDGGTLLTEIGRMQFCDAVRGSLARTNIVGIRQRTLEGPTRQEWTLNTDPDFHLSDWVDGRLVLASLLVVPLAMRVVRRRRLEVRDALAKAALERSRLQAYVDCAHR